MPAVDKPLSELLEYKSSSPKPADFDAYWSRALADLAAVSPNLEWVDSDFKVSYANCRSLYFSGVGGARIHAKVAAPNPLPKTPSPAIVMFHGYTGSSPDWMTMLPYVAAGFTVLGLDCRGQGGRSEDTVPTIGNTLHGHIIKGLDDHEDKLYYRNVYLDTVQLTHIAIDLEWVDAERVGCMGGSQGGALAIACAALEPRIKRTSSHFPFLSDFKRVWTMGMDQNAYAGLRDYFRRFDPLHEKEEEIFEKLGYIDICNLAPRIRGEVRMALTLLDNICPPSTQFAVYNAITSKKHKAVYSDFGHENLPGAPEANFQFMLQL
ncbi:alpha/beta fold hydrolase [Puniceicoccus vermicola]|uniref:Alpha/beta fold hydrolase n=1 Tax=Puniceicoccus vermicola TaxID=388746 RepID=A0A7X1AUY4_9BACT|nr:alpha/beta fold hydrolase [Puniceicoccus vermicola]MBC2600344.1 alpha/beta fold hydrolase [Puniceicoccus vermicola]